MTKKICIIGGTSLLDSDILNGFKKITAKNKYGRINLFQKENIFFIQRHDGGTPPHRINYKAYIQFLFESGVKNIISINSVGSLKKKFKPGNLIVPHDFISPWNIPTFFDDEVKHVLVDFNKDLRQLLYKGVKKVDANVYNRGVYMQAIGPRWETSAEIRMFAKFADMVGMTLGSEVTLASEKGIALASLCVVDNYCNGIVSKEKIDYDLIKKRAQKNHDKVKKIIENVLIMVG